MENHIKKYFRVLLIRIFNAALVSTKRVIYNQNALVLFGVSK